MVILPGDKGAHVVLKKTENDLVLRQIVSSLKNVILSILFLLLAFYNTVSSLGAECSCGCEGTSTGFHLPSSSRQERVDSCRGLCSTRRHW